MKMSTICCMQTDGYVECLPCSEPVFTLHDEILVVRFCDLSYSRSFSTIFFSVNKENAVDRIKLRKLTKDIV